MLSNNDEMALGAVAAYDALDYDKDRRPMIFGIDGLEGALDAVKKGTIQGTVYNDRHGQDVYKRQVLDEPTSSLTAPEVEKLFKMMRQLREQGISLIYISHKMDEIFEICDQVSVLRDGALVMTKNCSDTNMNELISAMVGRSLDNRFPPVDNTPGDVILRVEHLSTKYAPKLQDITLSLIHI